MIEWNEIRQQVLAKVESDEYTEEHRKRLKFEIKEVEKQGANAYWAQLVNDNHKYETNENGLVLPWLLGMTPADPFLSQHKIEASADWPDIDFDCIPEAREHIKNYAAARYGEDKTCSVGTWLTYKFRSALQDVVRAYAGDVKEVILLTTNLPDDVDDLKDGGYAPCMGCKHRHKEVACPKCGSEEVDGTTIGKLIDDYDNLKLYNDMHPDIVDMAVRMVGKIKSLGTHAGGVIISKIPLFGNIPMARSNGRWTSLWTEGRSTQLSKFGYVKWDVLGLKTLQYIHDCCQMINKTRGFKFDSIPWARQNREEGYLGTYSDSSGKEYHIRMDDEEVFRMINELRTETVFQFETDVQRGILSNGVRDYYDLQVFNAMGHPGPMDMIPDYVKRRDDTDRLWMKEEHPQMAQELIETHGIVVYQEDLQRLWQKFASFTAPEAEAARKAVAKKWKDKLKPVKEQWIRGATKLIGEKWAVIWWDRMESFGRYAFNKSHSCSYIMLAYLSAWLKIHFPPEWWASVMSSCHHDKLVKYMNIARSEGVKFGDINVEDISISFTVEPGTLMVTPGLGSIKGVGDVAVNKMQPKGKYTNIDEFVEANGKNKTVLQRLILLGAFQRYHPNIKATWMWYQYKYCSGISELKKQIQDMLLVDWTPEKIQAEQQRQIAEFKVLYPKRHRIPPKILNWKPKVKDDRESVMALFTSEDFTLKQRLAFEKEYLGYYWHSPMDLYHTEPGRTIKDAKMDDSGVMEVVVEKVWIGKTKKDRPFAKITVTDGLNNANVLVWEDELAACRDYLRDGRGVRLYINYDQQRDSFALKRGTAPYLLETTAEYTHRMLNERGTQPEVVEELVDA